MTDWAKDDSKLAAEFEAQRPARAPAAGERSALVGFVPQYEVAAGLLLAALTEEVLEWIALLDPTAGRLDDFQLATPGRLDAYQVKWSQAGGQLSWGELRAHLVDLVRDRRTLADAHRDRAVFGHLYSDRVASSGRISGAPQEHRAATCAGAMAQLLLPASEGSFDAPSDLPARWRWLWRPLADACQLSEAELLAEFAQICLELGRTRPTTTALPGRDGVAYRRDLDELTLLLFQLATDPHQHVRLIRSELLDYLGENWRRRLELVSVHEFPRPHAYHRVDATVAALEQALQRHTNGYVALIGSPGSGKSTLLGEELQGRTEVVARYYAYVRGRTDIGSVRSDASAFLHDLVLTLERAGLPRGPTPVDFDVAGLQSRLTRQLAQLGDRYRETGERAVIVVDGLDHVDRERGVERPFLRYLPRPDELPAGVLFVVGSQSVRMLDAQVRAQLTTGGRTIEMTGLSSSAVAEVAKAWDVSADATELWRISEGHPLILSYLLEELRGLTVDQQAELLAAAPAYGGDVRAVYERLWQVIEDDDELVELLGLASRIRGGVDLAWLRDRGQSAAVVRRLRERLAHFFRRDPEVWQFFHESLRLFLQEKTASVVGVHDGSEDRRFHALLAEMCGATAKGDAQSWDQLFHLAAADEHTRVLELATPEFFRAQWLALRPRESVDADIRAACRSLASTRDQLALVRLAIAAGELAQRSYHLPDREDFFELLVRTGNWRTASEWMDAEGESFGMEDDRTARLRISLLLLEFGHAEEGRRVFEGNEPSELLRGQEPLKRSARGPYQLLYAWARAAGVFRGPDEVIRAANLLELPDDLELSDSEEGNATPSVRAWMLAAAADELATLGSEEQAEVLLGDLSLDCDVDRDAWVWAHVRRWHRHPDQRAAIIQHITDRVRPQDVGDHRRVDVAEGLLLTGDATGARHWVDVLSQPPLPDARSAGELWESEWVRYRTNRLLSALGDRSSAEDLLPTPQEEYSRGYTYIGRAVIRIAQLHGRTWAGETVEVGEFLAIARSIIRTLEIDGDWSLNYKLRQVRPHALAQLIRAAREQSRDVVQATWAELVERWRADARLLLQEGRVVLPVAFETDVISRSEVLEWTRELEQVVRMNVRGAEAARGLFEMAQTMMQMELEDDARRLTRDAVGATLAVAERKDYQVEDWIGLLGPELEAEQGRQLVRRLAGSLVDLHEHASGAGDAAQRLLVDESARRPRHAWYVGEWLEERRVVTRDVRILALLQARHDLAGDALWWTVLGEALVPISPSASPELIREAGVVAMKLRGQSWLRERLLSLLERVHVEAPPGSREGWIGGISKALADAALSRTDVGLPVDALPQRSRSRGTGEAERDAFLAAHTTVAALLSSARIDSSSGSGREWFEAVDLLADQMVLEDVEATAAIFAGSDTADLQIQVRLAQRASELNAPDIARSLIETVIRTAGARSWRVSWDGGPLLGAFRLLTTLEPSARERAYRRFAADASSDTYLLSEVSRDLARYLDVFGIDDRAAIGTEVKSYLDVLLSEPQHEPRNQLFEEGEAPSVLAVLLIDLLACPYRLAVTSAQRALMAALEDGEIPVHSELVRALETEDEELALRIMSVLEAALLRGSTFPSEVTDAVHRWTVARHIAVRQASRRMLERDGRELDPIPAVPLPAAYQLSVPERESPAGMIGAELVGRDDLEVVTVAAEGQLARLATAAGVDSHLLDVRSAALARSLAGDTVVDDKRWQSASSPLGWTYYKPSVILWERAAAHIASELTDAGRVSPNLSVLMSVGPCYDAALIASRPSRRPDEVVAVLSDESQHSISPDDWLDGIRDAEHRLVRALPGDWIVIGELTELRHLDRHLPREQRRQYLGVPDASASSQAIRLSRTLLSEIDSLPVSQGATPLIEHSDVSYRGPSTWLMLHPRLAEACGWQRNGTALFAWHDEEGLLIRSLWWRSGWLDSNDWYGHAEVGEGWLVLAQPRAVYKLGETLGGEPRLAWHVERDFMAEGYGVDERRGTRVAGDH